MGVAAALEAEVEDPPVLEALVSVAVALVPVAVEPEVPVEAPVEQTTELGISVTPPRAQIDLATLRVAVECERLVFALW